tara:strand:+ start:288 stop:506 length:219 start_codon:yes stop_codon:yes gene_type:complete
MRKSLIHVFFLLVFSWILGGCSTEAMSFSQGFLEGYNEKMREERYINNMIQLEKEKQKTALCLKKTYDFCEK